MPKTLSFLLLLTLAFLSACGQYKIDQFPDHGFLTKSASDGRQYVLFVPRHLEPGKKYPMIVFLHGVGEGGSNINDVIRVGIGPYVGAHLDTFDFFVLFPQSATGNWNENSAAAGDVIDAIDRTCNTYPVDQDRISLTGLSTGGYGTFAIGAAFPSRFAALVPLCANEADTKDADTLAHMNIWSFENAGDPFGGLFSTQRTIGAIRAAAGTPKSTIYPLPGHDCWTLTYEQGELFDWLRNTKRQ